jgi:RNA-directed DNA polymerase
MHSALKGPKGTRLSTAMAQAPDIKKQFLSLGSFDELANLLGLTSAGLRFFCHTKPYQTFALAKKTGGVRMISAPSGKLKTIQRRLAAFLLDVYGSRAPVHGFVRGRSIKSNAAPHVSRGFVFNIDLLNFFPSIHYGRVRGLFMNKPYSLPYQVANALAQLTCHLGTLPQGAPTSPIVSNLICGGLDAKLKSLARLHKCRYTRYADDITFSCTADSFPTAIASFNGTSWVAGVVLEGVISTEGFAINPTKTTMRLSGARQTVTGLIVNKKTNLSRNYVKSVRGMIGSLETKGLAKAEADFHAKYDTKQSLNKTKLFAKVIAGRVNHVGFVKGWDSSTYISFASRLRKQNIIIRKHPVDISQSASRSVLYQAIWLIDAGLSEECAVQQSSGFSLGKHGVVTAAHAVGEYDKSGKWKIFDYIQLRQPHLGIGAKFKAKVLRVHDHADLALIEYPYNPLVALQSGAGEVIEPRDVVNILGFPHYHDGDSCTDQDFAVNAKRVYSGIQHRVVVGSILTGNSGGPVLNQRNEVIGIALKGQQIPAHFGDKDSLSSFAIVEMLDLLFSSNRPT